AQSRRELERNLPRFQNDYRQGLEEYFEGKLNIDDLLTRREELFWQEYEISRLKYLISANVAELCAATGRFFELLDGQGNGSTPLRPVP
ncbi:MAG: hypothetical protein PVI86_13210, partial [Phycisphaerae bacterium]